jgi:uncharacterized protein YciI
MACVVIGLLPMGPSPAWPGAQEQAPPRYEMTTYYVALLYRGEGWTPEVTAQTEAIQKAHMANINRLAAEGKLLLAGPFSDDGDLRGMFVLKVGSIDEARASCDTDPAVQAGRLRCELHPWFSAKGIRVDPRGDGETPDAPK